MLDDFNRFAESNAAVFAGAVPVGIVITNSLGNLVFVNAELERMTGHVRGELRGQPVDLLLPERFPPRPCRPPRRLCGYSYSETVRIRNQESQQVAQ